MTSKSFFDGSSYSWSPPERLFEIMIHETKRNVHCGKMNNNYDHPSGKNISSARNFMIVYSDFN